MFIVFIIIVLLVVFIVDWYSLKGLRSVLKSKYKRWITYAWVSPTIFMLCCMVYFMLVATKYPGGNRTSLVYIVSGISFTTIATKATIFVFHLFDDAKEFFKWLGEKFSKKKEHPIKGERISRGNFLTQLGVGVSAITFGSFTYGVTRGKYNYKVVEQELAFPHLPEAFDSVKIIQISDLHLGSFLEDDNSVLPGLKLVNELDADYIFFTGDLVNSVAEEAEFWIPHFKNLSAKRGKFSILGNHDYGEYAFPDDPERLARNMVQLKHIHAEMGFDLLLNENRSLSKDGETIDLIGVENWGEVLRFPRKGDFEKASEGLNPESFNILLSHDPTHWERKIMNNHNVDLTLSGHTHGFQFGVGLGNYKWSPASLSYNRWP